MNKSLIEHWLPVRELSRDAAIEMAYKPAPAYIRHCKELKIGKKIGRNFYDPKIRNLHPWFARRPCSIARSITLSGVLPDNVNKEDFVKSLGLDRKANAFTYEGYPPLLFYTDPNRNLIDHLISKLLGKRAEEIITCDPMAGGGTIPLENLRLGFKSIGVEYNPVAYLILKATVEYPAKFGKELGKCLKDESINLISFIREKLGKYYPKDCEGYILARGIDCPSCKGNFPLLQEMEINNSTFLKLNFDKTNKKFNLSIMRHFQGTPHKTEGKSKIKCPYCGFTMTKQQAYEIWTKSHIGLLRALKNGQFDEERLLKTHILLVKQTRNGYSIPGYEDTLCFLESYRELGKFGDVWEHIPTDDIPLNNEVFFPLRKYGIEKWYEIFNPRQLLALGALIKYVYNRSELLLKDKGELGEALLLYLALGVSRVADYNSIITTWKRGTIRDTLGRYAQNRRMTYGEEYCEAIIPYRNIEWIFEANYPQNKMTQGGICPIVDELCKRLEGLGKNVSIIHGDCRFLSSILRKPVNLINVDPPYFDQQIYSDVSEYFWQILRLCLKKLIENGMIFEQEAVTNWNPISPMVPREGEIIVRKKSKGAATDFFSAEWYTRQMGIFFKECNKILLNDGILLTWFTHRSLDAWNSIISSLYAGGFYVTRIWPFVTELLSRLVSKRNKSTINQTLIIVSRKRPKKSFSEEELKQHAIKLIEELCEAMRATGTSEREFYTFIKASAICATTIIEPPEGADPFEYFYTRLIPFASKLTEEMMPLFQSRFKPYRIKEKLEDFI